MSPLRSSKRQRADMPTLDRRYCQRVNLSMLGRYMLSDHREFPCQIIDMSPCGLALTAPVIGRANEVVIVYLDHIGRVEGKIARIFEGGFAISIRATVQKRDKWANILTWLANREILNLPEDRRHNREIPQDPFTKVILPDGSEASARILDMSLSGAAIALDKPTRIGDILMIGKVRTKVVRMFDDGVAVEFSRNQQSQLD